jgi:hypothetical protein
MRRPERNIRRRRIEDTAADPDALSLAFPGLACGILALVLVLYAGTIRRAPVAVTLLPVPAAPVRSSVAASDSSSLAVLTSARRAKP